MNKVSGREGRVSGRHTAGSSHIEPHAQALIRPPSADARYPDQLPQPVAGALVDPDDSDLLGIGAEPDREPRVGAMSICELVPGGSQTPYVFKRLLPE